MHTSQLGFFYTLCLAFFLALALGASHLLDDKPMSAEDYANKLCQELYGPQVGAVWIDASLRCESVRGEIIEVRKP